MIQKLPGTVFDKLYIQNAFKSYGGIFHLQVDVIKKKAKGGKRVKYA